MGQERHEHVAGEVSAKFTCGDWHDRTTLGLFAQSCDVVTYEFENVPVAPLSAIPADRLLPGTRALEVAQDRLSEKRFVEDLGGRPAPYAAIDADPELQGAMGKHYATHDRERPEVAAAIAEHYAPQGPSDACPSAPESVAVALADKLDTLVGFFAIGEKPTGSKDPFALRRAALGVIRLLLENRVRLSLRAAFKQALAGYGEQFDGVDADAVSSELLAFFADRLKVHLKDAGVRHDLISAVFAAGEEDDLVRLLAKVEALRAFLATDDGANLLVALRRASNIVRIEEKRDGRSYTGQPDGQRLEAKEEQMLFFRLMTVGGDIAGALEREEFGEAMAALARLRQPVDAFFDRVTVNAEEPELRENRLYLLGQIRSALGGIADFSLIEDTIQAEQGDRRVA